MNLNNSCYKSPHAVHAFSLNTFQKHLMRAKISGSLIFEETVNNSQIFISYICRLELCDYYLFEKMKDGIYVNSYVNTSTQGFYYRDGGQQLENIL